MPEATTASITSNETEIVLVARVYAYAVALNLRRILRQSRQQKYRGTIGCVLLTLLLVLVLFDQLVQYQKLNSRTPTKTSPRVPPTTDHLQMAGWMDIIEQRRQALGWITPGVAKPDLSEKPWLGSDLKHGFYKAYAGEMKEPAQSVLLIIPYRDRPEHLRTFLDHIHPFLQNQTLTYQILVVTQAGKGAWNKGRLFNVGFLYMTEVSRREFDCITFHDVDLIPLNPDNKYGCYTRFPRHLSTSVDKFAFQDPYKIFFNSTEDWQLVGGVLAMTPFQFRTVNGFSNEYWKWGAEDDDMYRRIRKKGFRVMKNDPTWARYSMLAHHQGSPNKFRWFLLRTWEYRLKRDGLNSVWKGKNNRTDGAKISAVNYQQEYINLTVDVGAEPDFGIDMAFVLDRSNLTDRQKMEIAKIMKRAAADRRSREKLIKSRTNKIILRNLVWFTASCAPAAAATWVNAVALCAKEWPSIKKTFDRSSGAFSAHTNRYADVGNVAIIGVESHNNKREILESIPIKKNAA